MSCEVEFLTKTADILELNGWRQGSYNGDDGSHCVIGAMNDVARDNELNLCYSAAAGALVNHLRDIGRFDGCYDLVGWNDKEGRTASEVVEALRQTAQELESQDA